MDKKEFNRWTDDVIRNKYKKDVNCAVVFNESIGKTIVIDTNTNEMAFAKCHEDDTFKNNVGLAIAYAKLRGIPIPEVSDEPQRWRAGYEERYHVFSSYLCPELSLEVNDHIDNNRFKVGNYFKTRKQAGVISEKIKHLLKLYQYKLMYDAEYEPDWSVSNHDYKYYIYFNVETIKYSWDFCHNRLAAETVYFSSMGVAQKICDLLNKELMDSEDCYILHTD